MESRKLGNKTKMIKLMSKVGNYGLIILTSATMRKAGESLITIRNVRIKGMRILIKGRKVLNLLTSGISRSNHHKLRSSQP